MEWIAEPCSPVSGEHFEGPFWDGERLGWVDIGAGRLSLALIDGGDLAQQATYEIGRPLGAAVPAAAGGWLLAAGAGFAHLPAEGKLTELVSVGDAGLVRMNDGKCDPGGRFWAGTMAYDAAHGAGALFQLSDGSVRIVLPRVTISNGLGWSPSGTTMYYTDSKTFQIDAFDYDVATGEAANRRLFAEADGCSPESGCEPDGMAVDDEGCLWVAIWGGGVVQRYDPSGRLIGVVRVAATNPTSCCFAGSALFITSSRLGLSEAELAKEPDAGRIFRADVGVSAPPAAPYQGPIT